MASSNVSVSCMPNGHATISVYQILYEALYYHYMISWASLCLTTNLIFCRSCIYLSYISLFYYCFIPLLHLSQRRTFSGSNFVFSIFLELAPHSSLALFWSRRCHGFLGDRWLGPKSPQLLMTVMTILRMNLYVVAFAFVYLALSIPDGHLVLV